MGKAFFLLPFFIFFGLIVYFAIPIVKKSDPRLIPSALINKKAPRQDLPPLLESLPGIKKSNLTGEVKLVNFFSSWCGPCRVEHDLLMKISKDGDIPLYGINYKDDRKSAISWLNELGNPFHKIGVDRSGRNAIDWGVYGVPETYIVDYEGKIRYRHVGPLNKKILIRDINPLIEFLRKSQNG